MIKKLLFIAAIISTGSLLAQNLDLKDANDVSINGLTHYIYGKGDSLANVKFHVGNSSGTAITFDAVLTEITNPIAEDWQICFGSACFIAPAGIPTPQIFDDAAAIAPATGIYTNFKVGPFSFSWAAGDYGRWMVKAVNSTDANDFSEACVVWTVEGTFAGDQNNNTIMDGSELAGDIDLNGIIDGNEILGDMDGSGTIDPCEVSGDGNGNGVIDNGEVLSVVEFDKNNVNLSVYPNPVLDNLTINYNIAGDFNNAAIDVYDVLGQKVKTYILSNKKGQLSINAGELNSGVYFYTIKVGNKSIRTERVIIK